MYHTMPSGPYRSTNPVASVLPSERNHSRTSMHPPISLPENEQSPSEDPQTVGSSSPKDSSPVTRSTKPLAWYGNDSWDILDPSRNSMFSDTPLCHGSMPKSLKFPQYTEATSWSTVVTKARTVLSEYPWNHFGLSSTAFQSM